MSEFRILVATSRPTIQAFLAGMRRTGISPVVIDALPLDSTLFANASEACEASSVAVVDAAVEPAEALEVCRQMRAHRPSLPISALFCCPHAATATHLRALVAEGVSGFLDLHLSTEEMLHALCTVARGDGVFHLQLSGGSNPALFEVFNANGKAEGKLSEDDVGLLRLLAGGLTDHEIGRELYLSPHTVKHRIERIRRRAEARNRVQLAAWAVRQDALRSVSWPSA